MYPSQDAKDADIGARLTDALTRLSALDDDLVGISRALSTPVEPPPPPWSPPQPDGTAAYAATYASDLSPWAGKDVDPGCTVIPVKLADGPAAYAFTQPGGHRAELSGFGTDQSYRRMSSGREVYFGQSILWPADFPESQLGFHINMQLHTSKRATFGGKQSAVQLSAMDNTVKLRSRPNAPSVPEVSWSEPLRRDVWLHVVQWFRISRLGRWAAWVRWDDEHEYRPVIIPSDLDILVDNLDWAYFKTGVYRSAVNTDPVGVYHRLALSGSTFAAVQR